LTAYPSHVAELGWAIVVISTVGLGVVVFALRRRPPGGFVTIVAAAAGAGVAVGGLLVVGDVGVASWIVAPLVLGAAVPLQVRALLASGGPFRT
jgi:hypothetical protein